ncbi:hypothetical protein PIB30_088003 [Stylosanthes scabra]|uniref:Putative plant transposon protein domain-containing protein n=1 Tax=Stylosanthes scabra TaxID=79078 RepID=A0ABU6ZS85_9FABA|nr:hypothetical protein [Stylosanthes scabra]
MTPKSRKRNASGAPSSSQIPDTSQEPTYDATRFKSLAHERHFEEVVQFRLPILEVSFSLKRNEFKYIKDEITRRGWDLLCNLPQKKMGIKLLREFYANARMTRRDKQSNPRYITFVRGKDIDFSLASIKVILQLPDIDDNEQSYEARRQADDQRLNNVLRDIGGPFAQWKLDNKKKPSQIKRRELNPTARESKDETKRLPFPSIIYRLLYANGIMKIDGDKLIPIERPITAESMRKNKYLEIQQEIQQQFPQHPPQVQQEQNQHDQTLPEQFNWQELNQQFQGMRVDQSQFYQNFQEQQKQFFEDFGNQQKLYKQEFQDLRVQHHQYHQEL